MIADMMSFYMIGLALNAVVNQGLGGRKNE